MKIREIAPPPDGAGGQASKSDPELKAALLNAAQHGWSKPRMGTAIRAKLDQFMTTDHEFLTQLQAMRPDWITGEGDGHVGALNPNNFF